MTQSPTNSPIIATVTSGKGGVGKTFVTVNLAATLAAQGLQVLVVDCDLGLANVDIMLGVHPRLSLKDILFGNALPEDVIIPVKGGFHLLPACSGVHGQKLLYEKIQIVKTVVLSLEGYDVILLDTGAGIAQTVLQFNLLAPRNIVVLNRELTSITDAYAMMKVLHQVFGRDTFSLIANSVADERDGRRKSFTTSTGSAGGSWGLPWTTWAPSAGTRRCRNPSSARSLSSLPIPDRKRRPASAGSPGL